MITFYYHETAVKILFSGYTNSKRVVNFYYTYNIK